MQTMETMEHRESSQMSSKSKGWFIGLVIFAEVLAIAAVIITGVWLGEYRGGFAWQEDPAREFNYHPLFMVIGFVFLYGNGILFYRVFRNVNKKIIKVLHATFHILALGCAIFALKAAFDSHNLATPPIPNMYSLHSWLGITTVVLFGLQWVFGLVTFLLPGLAPHIRAFYKPHHVLWGFAIFILVIATCLMGITEKNIFSNADYSQKDAEGMLTNSLGMILTALGFVIGYILLTSEFKRPIDINDIAPK